MCQTVQTGGLRGLLEGRPPCRSWMIIVKNIAHGAIPVSLLFSYFAEFGQVPFENEKDQRHHDFCPRDSGRFS